MKLGKVIRTQEEVDKERRLIAAAPDMLEALKLFLSLETHIEDGVAPIIDAARAAVAKAEGK